MLQYFGNRMEVAQYFMVEWRCVSMALGAPSVMISGTTEMPVWCADNWDTLHMVCCGENLSIKTSYISSIYIVIWNSNLMYVEHFQWILLFVNHMSRQQSCTHLCGACMVLHRECFPGDGLTHS